MNKLVSLWNSLPDSVKRAVHTFYQTFLATIAVGFTPVYTALINGHFNEAKVALFALVVAAGAAGISAVKAYVASKLGS